MIFFSIVPGPGLGSRGQGMGLGSAGKGFGPCWAQPTYVEGRVRKPTL